MADYSGQIRSLMAAIDAVREADETIPAQELLVFLAIAAEPGITMQDLGRRTELSQSSCSRNVMALGEWHRSNKPGLGLVEAVEDPNERRRKIMFLSPKGQRMVEKVVSAITGEPVQYEAICAQDYVDVHRLRKSAGRA